MLIFLPFQSQSSSVLTVISLLENRGCDTLIMKATPRLFLRPSSTLHPTSAPNIRLPSATKTTSPRLRQPLQTRPFVSNSLNPLQSLTAQRILPYHAAPLYNLIADISSYPSFLPYCTSSTITSHSGPDPQFQKQWPRSADLRVGWGPYDELFRSAVYCLPNSVLEAVAGDAVPTIPRSKLPHYYDSEAGDLDPEKSTGNKSIFTSLLTRWTLREFPFKPPPPDGSHPQEGNASKASRPRTEIDLVIEVRFASAVYSALSQAAAPKVAGMMIEAFEKRAREALGKGVGE